MESLLIKEQVAICFQMVTCATLGHLHWAVLHTHVRQTSPYLYHWLVNHLKSALEVSRISRCDLMIILMMKCYLVNSAPSNVTITGELNVIEHSFVTYQCSADGFPTPSKL